MQRLTIREKKLSDENTLDDLDGNTPEWVKQLRKENAELKKQAKEQQEQLGVFLKEKRQTSVADILKARGVNTKYAELYHGEDASEDAVGKWAETYFPTSQQNDQPDPNAEAARQVSQASFGEGSGVARTPMGVVGDPAAIAELLANGTDEELVKAGLLNPVQQRNQLRGGYIDPMSVRGRLGY